jgi:hypothetical protein
MAMKVYNENGVYAHNTSGGYSPIKTINHDVFTPIQQEKVIPLLTGDIFSPVFEPVSVMVDSPDNIAQLETIPTNEQADSQKIPTWMFILIGVIIFKVIF